MQISSMRRRGLEIEYSAYYCWQTSTITAKNVRKAGFSAGIFYEPVDHPIHLPKIIIKI